MMKTTLTLAEYGSQLWTRELARQIRERVAGILDKLEPGNTLVIDAKGVEVFDYSFANELFGKALLTLSSEFPDRFLIIENLTPYTHENLAKALDSLNLVMIEQKGRVLQLIGKVHPTDEETFKAIARAKSPVSATALRDQLGINLTAMNERLTKLTRLAVVRRYKGTSSAGRERYLYGIPA